MARAKRRERCKARALRREGVTLRAIARRLGVSLSSVSVWVRDVPLPSSAEPQATPEPPVDTGPFRECSRCARTLPAGAFKRHGESRQWWCRDCFKSYFKERGENHLYQVRRSQRKRQRDATAFIRGYLTDHPCKDCGVNE